MNAANYDEVANTTTVVGTSGGPSAYGTYDQSGNVYEWTEGLGRAAGTRVARGGRFVGRNGSLGLRADYRHEFPAGQRQQGVGVRLCSHGYGSRADSGIRQRSPLANPLGWSEFAYVGDPGNQPDRLEPVVKDGVIEHDDIAIGAVEHDYLIQRFPLTTAEWCEFLNAIPNPQSVLALGQMNGRFATLRLKARTVFEAIEDGLQFEPLPGSARRPIGHVSWLSAARLANWLANGRGDTENGAYDLSQPYPIQRNAVNPYTGLPPTYWIPTDDEWHKAAYYKGGSINAGYWSYATQSDEPPRPANLGRGWNGSDYAPPPDLGGISTTVSVGGVTLRFADGLLVEATR
jgi:formylglycine-generating enzyme required for sulfatase activity